MKILFLIVTLLVAAVADWSMGYLFPSWLPPLPVMALLVWFLYLPFLTRLTAAIIVGFIADTFYPVPFGTYLAALLFLAFFSQVLKMFLVESAAVLTRLLTFGILVFLTVFLVPLLRVFLLRFWG